MKRFPELKPNGWDMMVLAVVVVLGIVLSLGWMSAETDRLTAKISVDGVETEAVNLPQLRQEEERTIQANGYTLYLVLSQKGVQVRESDCPTQDCVHTGIITRAGQSIVCLPARVTVQLQGTVAEDGVDAVLG